MQPQPARFPAQSERKLTSGNFEMPRSVVENLSLLPHAELCMVLIVHRIQTGGRPTVISDEHWQKWTGLKPRVKRLAIEGLKAKGLSVLGVGDKARYYFDSNTWEAWARTQRPEEKSRTPGYAPKPGQKIHPDCVKNGCQRLCEEKENCDTSKVVSIAAAAPVCEAEFVDTPQTEENRQNFAKNPPNSLIVRSEKRTEGENDHRRTAREQTFRNLMSVFLSLGVPISDADVGRCKSLWAKLKPAEQTTALAYAVARNEDDWGKRELRYIPKPWNYMERKDWERRAPERKEPEVWNPFET